MDFHNMIDAIQNPSEEGIPEGIYDDLRGAYDSLQGNFDAASEKIKSLTDENTGFKDQISDLKSKSYDLMTQIGLKNDEHGNDDPSATVNGPSDDDGSIDAFFANKEGK